MTARVDATHEPIRVFIMRQLTVAISPEWCECGDATKDIEYLDA